MIDIRNVNFSYNERNEGALKNFSMHIEKGECVLICGRSGCGKTTVTRLVNGLIPHYYEGNLTGEVHVCGQDNIGTPVEKISRHVGSVFQNPRSQFFCVDTISEIAFGCENQGLDRNVIMQRVNDVSRSMKIEDLLGRNIFNLSGGEKQKIACAGVAAGIPEVIVMDEPTSNLDLYAIDDLAGIVKAWKNMGITILIAEHRLAWLKGICDRVIFMEDGCICHEYVGADFFSLAENTLGDMGLRSVGDDMRRRYMSLPVGLHYIENGHTVSDDGIKSVPGSELGLLDFSFSYGKRKIFEIHDMRIPFNSIVAVIGKNGVGKSTFSRSLCGLTKGCKGDVMLDGEKYSVRKRRKISYMVMQDVNHQLFAEDVEEEAALGVADENQNMVDKVLEELELSEYRQFHPMSLSGGQKQRVAIASAILADKKLIVLDEPTSGLDHRGMQQTAGLLKSVKKERILFVVTHDMELIESCCDYVLRF